MRVRWTKPALHDLEAIGDTIEREHSATAAARIITTILERTETLTRFPQAGRPGRVRGTRELVGSGTSFVVPYRLRAMDIEILAVFHGARQWPETFD